MASSAKDTDPDGVEFIQESDGRVTAKDRLTGVASFGETRAEALRMLADALESHEEATNHPDDEVPESDAPWL
ncbi:type II toxin-antitoxin system HicB family antitoxin [Halorussus amylolyticus]|uniref:type II toxin-antitoxin system HicB family antitoxin n=1 Tax=Halorussus amylolyticus TaxID=1126242 RepID=UPI001047EEB8|nr:hypothetical protein [Halorussus amylolyticus]